MADNNTLSYSTLITQAIQDFDAIGGVLVNRGLIADTATMSDGTVPTSAYAGLMEKLVTVSKDGVAISGSALGYNIVDKRGETVTGGQSTFEYKTGNTINFTLKAGEIGLYNTDTIVTGTLTGATETITGTIGNGTNVNIATAGDTYTITPKDNTVISSIAIKKATVALEVDAEASGAQSGSTNLTFTTGALQSGTFKEALGEGDSASDYVAVGASANGTITGKISGSAKVAAGFVGGYISSVDDISVGSASETPYSVKVQETGTLYIKKAVAPAKLTTTDVLTLNGTGAVVSEGSTKYAVTLSSNKITSTGTVTAGYLSQNATISSEVAAGSGTIYINEGSVGTIAATIGMKVANNGGLNLAASGSDVYTVQIKLKDNDAAVNSITLESTNGAAGYVDNGNTEAVITGEALELKLAHAKATISGAVTINKESASSSIFKTGSGDYTLTLNTTNTASATATEGYIKAGAGDIQGSVTNGNATFSIDRFAGSLAANLQAVVVDKEGDGAGSSTGENNSVVDIFLTESQMTEASLLAKDHYKITATSSLTKTKNGYLDQDLQNATKDLYLPKATLEYVQASDTTDEVLQVTRGGYLPAGFIGSISSAGKIKGAEFSITATDDAGILTTSGAAATHYQVTLTKAVSKAGYLGSGADEGTLTNADAYFIKHGGVSLVEHDLPAIEFGEDITWDAASSKYIITANNTAQAKVTLSEGYIKSGDLKVNNAAVEGTESLINLTTSGSLKLNKATLGVKTSVIAIKASLGEGLLSGKNATDGYAINAVLDGEANKLVINTSTAGYLSTDDEQEFAVTDGSVQGSAIYIKRGTGITTSLTGSANQDIIVTDFADDDVKGAYTISLAENAAITTTTDVQAGYYGGTEITAAAVAQTIGISTVANVVSVDRGAVSVAPAVELELSSTGVQLHANAGSGYHVLTLNAADMTDDASVTPGYTKAGDVSVVDLTTTLKQDVYSIMDASQKVANYAITAGNGTGNNKETPIPVSGTYASQNITVTLHEDATGSAVDAKLQALADRLAGK